MKKFDKFVKEISDKGGAWKKLRPSITRRERFDNVGKFKNGNSSWKGKCMRDDIQRSKTHSWERVIHGAKRTCCRPETS